MSKTTLVLLGLAGAAAAVWYLSKGKGSGAGGRPVPPSAMPTCSEACNKVGGRMLKINTKPPHWRCMKGTKMQFSCLALNARYPGKV
jgi:hypothetical protein